MAYLSKLPLLPEVRIAVKSGGCGFFGDLFMSLNGLRFAESNNIEARVDWDEKSLYFDPELGGNAWEYFFSQPVLNEPRAFKFPYFPGARHFLAYDHMSVRESVSIAIDKWCRPNETIMSEVEVISGKISDSDNHLGVHIRRTDAANGFEGRASPTMTSFIESTEQYLVNHGECPIFLATDDSVAVHQFEERFPGLVQSQEAFRSGDGRSIHGHYDNGVSGSPYLKGKQVLVDAILLSRSKFLIRSHSRVTAFSLCLNPELEFLDLDRVAYGTPALSWLK